MAATAGHRLTLDPMGKCSHAFFSETTNMIKAKLYMNVHWMVLYKLYVFCSDMKFQMAAMAGLSLTWDPMGKMFQNASFLKARGKLKPNCPGMITIKDFRFGTFPSISGSGYTFYRPPLLCLCGVQHFDISYVLVPCCDIDYDFHIKTMFGSL